MRKSFNFQRLDKIIVHLTDMLNLCRRYIEFNTIHLIIIVPALVPFNSSLLSLIVREFHKNHQTRLMPEELNTSNRQESAHSPIVLSKMDAPSNVTNLQHQLLVWNVHNFVTMHTRRLLSRYTYLIIYGTSRYGQ